MDQVKIGAFIQTLRKEQNLTQKELAERLGVTDRAISKWENGRGMPEVSLMKPLCDLLGITINELLSGERITKEDYQVKSEFRFLDTIQYSDKKIKQKNALLRVIAAITVILLVTAIVLIYWIPVTRGFFGENADLEFFWVEKTLPIAPYGETLERFSLTDFVVQDITEKIDLEKLEELLPLMQVTVYKDEFNTSGFWQGDYIYEIFGYFRSGPRQGEAFHVMIGDNNRNYLMPSGPGTRVHTIAKHDTWLNIMEELEDWEGEYRETFEEGKRFSLFYQGALYSGIGKLMNLPDDAQHLDSITTITSEPDEELECSFGRRGDNIYRWTADGQTYLGIQISYGKAYGVPVEMN